MNYEIDSCDSLSSDEILEAMIAGEFAQAIHLFFKDVQSDHCEEDGSILRTVQASVPSEGLNKQLLKIALPYHKEVLSGGVVADVYQAKLCDTNEIIAIKRRSLSAGVHSNDAGFIGVSVIERELNILRKLDHCNIVKLKYFYRDLYTELPLDYTILYNLFFVMERVPDSLHFIGTRDYAIREPMPLILIKVYMYQLFRALAYLHSLNICHRSIEFSHILVNSDSNILKLGGFGNAKELTEMHWVMGDPFWVETYAPEIMLGNIRYTTKIDLWQAGYVLADLLLGKPIFSRSTGIETLEEIVQILGPFTSEQRQDMLSSWEIQKQNNPATNPEGDFNPYLIDIFQRDALYKTEDGVHLISGLLEYSPHLRITPLQACIHPFFNELRDPRIQLPNDRILPPLFNFTDYELSIQPELKDRLLARYQTN